MEILDTLGEWLRLLLFYVYGKIVRATHAIAHSITLKNRILIKKIEEAKVLLEAERELAERTLEKQEIRLEYFIKILTNIG